MDYENTISKLEEASEKAHSENIKTIYSNKIKELERRMSKGMDVIKSINERIR